MYFSQQKAKGVSWGHFCNHELGILSPVISQASDYGLPALMLLISGNQCDWFGDECDSVSNSAQGGVKESLSSSSDFSFLFSGLVEPVNIVDNGDGTHTVTYTPSQEGPYMVSVKYADEEIPRR